jgi:uncharacterized protein YgiM (DUF1202 family)
MKSPFLLSLILSVTFACSSTSEENKEDTLAPEADVPASVAAKPETDVMEKPADANDVAAAVEAKLDAKAEEAEAVAPAAVPAPVAEAAQPAEAVAASSGKQVYPTTTLLNVRQGPGKSHAVARVAKFGEAITLTGEVQNTWQKTSDGLWVSSLFTADSKPDQPNDPVLQAAQN